MGTKKILLHCTSSCWTEGLVKLTGYDEARVQAPMEMLFDFFQVHTCSPASFPIPVPIVYCLCQLHSEQEQELWDLRIASKASVFLDDVDAFISEWRETGTVFGFDGPIDNSDIE